MLLISPAELAELRSIVADYHMAFVLIAFWEKAAAASPEEIAGLVADGILSEETAAGLGLDPIGDAFLTGMVLARLREETARTDAGANLDYEAVRQAIQNNPIPLSPTEKFAIEVARVRAGEYCRGLGNTIAEDLSEIFIEADEEQAAAIRSEIADAVQAGIARRKTIKQVASDIGNRKGDWCRDLERIAATELHDAMEEGEADYIEDRHGAEARVAKEVSPDACDECKALYQVDGHPRIFSLADLRANGTNVGRKRAQWQPVVGATHPWCGCTLVQVPDGYGFDEHGQLRPILSRATTEAA